MSTGCADCEREAEHCHGTLVRHADGHVECTDPACRLLGHDRHDLAMVCADGGCAIGPAGGDARRSRRGLDG